MVDHGKEAEQTIKRKQRNTKTIKSTESQQTIKNGGILKKAQIEKDRIKANKT